MAIQTNIVNKLWGFCHVLRHDGMDYGDYVEQLTYLLFLKMIEEKGAEIPKEYSWEVLKSKSGTDLIDFYTELLRGLAKQKGLLAEVRAAIEKATSPGGMFASLNAFFETFQGKWQQVGTRFHTNKGIKYLRPMRRYRNK